MLIYNTIIISDIVWDLKPDETIDDTLNNTIHLSIESTELELLMSMNDDRYSLNSVIADMLTHTTGLFPISLSYIIDPQKKIFIQ